MVLFITFKTYPILGKSTMAGKSLIRYLIELKKILGMNEVEQIIEG